MSESNTPLHQIYARCKKATRVDEEGRIFATSEAGSCVLDILKIAADAVARCGDAKPHSE